MQEKGEEAGVGRERLQTSISVRLCERKGGRAGDWIGGI